jgi:hypothetical protein
MKHLLAYFSVDESGETRNKERVNEEWMNPRSSRVFVFDIRRDLG